MFKLFWHPYNSEKNTGGGFAGPDCLYLCEYIPWPHRPGPITEGHSALGTINQWYSGKQTSELIITKAADQVNYVCKSHRFASLTTGQCWSDNLQVTASWCTLMVWTDEGCWPWSSSHPKPLRWQAAIIRASSRLMLLVFWLNMLTNAVVGNLSITSHWGHTSEYRDCGAPTSLLLFGWGFSVFSCLSGVSFVKNGTQLQVVPNRDANFSTRSPQDGKILRKHTVYRDRESMFPLWAFFTFHVLKPGTKCLKEICKLTNLQAYKIEHCRVQLYHMIIKGAVSDSWESLFLSLLLLWCCCSGRCTYTFGHLSGSSL